MIDTLWTLGRRLEALGVSTPFLDAGPAHSYENLGAAKAAMRELGARIAAGGIPARMAPLVFGVTGYGNVSRGAQEILDLLPFVEVQPGDLAAFVATNRDLVDRVVKVVYREEDLVEPAKPGEVFDLQHYYDHGDAYRSRFALHLPLLTVLVNGIFWDERYPKLADAGDLRALFSGEPPRLLVVGDITCDVDGSLACTMRDTEPGNPVYVYDPATRETKFGFEGEGLAVMAVGNLPCELPVEASMAFSEALAPFLPAMAEVDFDGSFEDAAMPSPIKNSVILWRGEFTPDCEYMRDFLR
jgi:alpha-aminoadipic semialdehyde synthase